MVHLVIKMCRINGDTVKVPEPPVEGQAIPKSILYRYQYKHSTWTNKITNSTWTNCETSNYSLSVHEG